MNYGLGLFKCLWRDYTVEIVAILLPEQVFIEKKTSPLRSESKIG